jgi:hypothetical protein
MLFNLLYVYQVGIMIAHQKENTNEQEIHSTSQQFFHESIA